MPDMIDKNLFGEELKPKLNWRVAFFFDEQTNEPSTVKESFNKFLTTGIENLQKLITACENDSLEKSEGAICSRNTLTGVKREYNRLCDAEPEQKEFCELSEIFENKWNEYRLQTNNEDAWSFKQWLLTQL